MFEYRLGGLVIVPLMMRSTFIDYKDLPPPRRTPESETIVSKLTKIMNSDSTNLTPKGFVVVVVVN